jgi:hypothetical protein
MNLMAMIQNIVKRVVVTLASAKPQVAHTGDGVVSDIEHLQPQGLHFVPVLSAQGLMLAPLAEVGSTVAINLSGAVPAGDIQPGEGGLHLAGQWKVFLAHDGTVHLSKKDPADFVALASKVDAEITRLDQAITTLVSAASVVAGAVDALASGTGSTFTQSTADLPGSASSVASAKVKVE